MLKPEEHKPPTATETFTASVNFLQWVIMSLSVPWTLFVRRFGTIGVRTYAIPMVINLVIQATLASGSLFPPEKALMTFILLATIALYIIHLSATFRRRANGRHVHSYNIGTPRMNRGGVFLEGAAGIALGVLLVNVHLPVVGLYIAVSAVCTVLITGMIQDRDRLRTIALKDAEYEQSVIAERYDA